MTAPSLDELLDWWTGEASDAAAERVEEALFADGAALAPASDLAALAGAVARATAGGGIPTASLTHTLVTQLENAGIPHRAYVVGPGETVPCAADPDQRFAVVRLRGDFRGVDRVDVVLRSPHLGELRFDDVAVSLEDGEVALLQAGDAVRALPTTTLRFELLGHRGGAEQDLGTYTLAHRAMD